MAAYSITSESCQRDIGIKKINKSPPVSVLSSGWPVSSSFRAAVRLQACSPANRWAFRTMSLACCAPACSGFIALLRTWTCFLALGYSASLSFCLFVFDMKCQQAIFLPHVNILRNNVIVSFYENVESMSGLYMKRAGGICMSMRSAVLCITTLISHAYFNYWFEGLVKIFSRYNNCNDLDSLKVHSESLRFGVF